jgi:hypothetical protein
VWFIYSKGCVDPALLRISAWLLLGCPIIGSLYLVPHTRSGGSGTQTSKALPRSLADSNQLCSLPPCGVRGGFRSREAGSTSVRDWRSDHSIARDTEETPPAVGLWVARSLARKGGGIYILRNSFSQLLCLLVWVLPPPIQSSKGRSNCTSWRCNRGKASNSLTLVPAHLHPSPARYGVRQRNPLGARFDPARVDCGYYAFLPSACRVPHLTDSPLFLIVL